MIHRMFHDSLLRRRMSIYQAPQFILIRSVHPTISRRPLDLHVFHDVPDHPFCVVRPGDVPVLPQPELGRPRYYRTFFSSLPACCPP